MAPTELTPLTLRGGRVTAGLRDAIFDEANRAGMSVNEFVLTAAAERLAQRGIKFAGVFEPGDLDQMGAAR
ncbi:hypothetical protein SAMN05216456_1592 [Devosia crocina]|uniref:Uncharacterized protein n=1 Tax=Devosia crocina TaxID=429728 RepID=A0A1I7NC87_9HYPH|nr:hypothetical protein [Devosia crocina]SFV32269.1 hypothetical protein SAMN05216456_1592 [Devosia crocina]